MTALDLLLMALDLACSSPQVVTTPNLFMSVELNPALARRRYGKLLVWEGVFVKAGPVIRLPFCRFGWCTLPLSLSFFWVPSRENFKCVKGLQGLSSKLLPGCCMEVVIDSGLF